MGLYTWKYIAAFVFKQEGSPYQLKIIKNE